MQKRYQTEAKRTKNMALKKALLGQFLLTNEKPVFFRAYHELTMRVIPTQIVNTSTWEKAVSKFHYLNPFYENQLQKFKLCNKPIELKLLSSRDSLLHISNIKKPPVPMHIVRRRRVYSEVQLDKLNLCHQNTWVISKKTRSKTRSVYSHYSSNHSTMRSTYRE